jgi:hypothetical protein
MNRHSSGIGIGPDALERLPRPLSRWAGTNRALTHYKAAVQIESDFRAQFKIMYSDQTETVSRIGRNDYQTAKRRFRNDG